MKGILSLILTNFLILGAVGFSYAHCGKIHLAQAQPSEEIEAVVEIGNEICPVSGEKIDEKNKVTYEYEGKVYNFCCPMCIDEFKKDPQKYIKKVEEELQTEPKEEAKEEQDEQMDSSRHQGHQHHHH